MDLLKILSAFSASQRENSCFVIKYHLADIGVSVLSTLTIPRDSL